MGSHMGMGAKTEALGKQLLCATSPFLAKRQLPIEHHQDINPLVLYSILVGTHYSLVSDLWPETERQKGTH